MKNATPSWHHTGKEQLAWVAQELDKGEPTIVLSHYMRLVTARDEYPQTQHRLVLAFGQPK